MVLKLFSLPLKKPGPATQNLTQFQMHRNAGSKDMRCFLLGPVEMTRIELNELNSFEVRRLNQFMQNS